MTQERIVLAEMWDRRPPQNPNDWRWRLFGEFGGDWFGFGGILGGDTSLGEPGGPNINFKKLSVVLMGMAIGGFFAANVIAPTVAPANPVVDLLVTGVGALVGGSIAGTMYNNISRRSI